MAEEQKKEFKLFREKSLEAIQSPEKLDDYLQVTSAGVWLVLGAVIALLVGVLFWSFLGRIRTGMNVAVEVSDEKCVCLIPYESLQKVVSSGEKMTIGGKEYELETDAEFGIRIISEDTNPYLRVMGGLEIGDVTVEIPILGELEKGVFQGYCVTESLKPISLLLQ